MEFFDSHAHLTSKELVPHFEAILSRAKIAGVTQILNICTNPHELQQGVLLKRKYSCIHNAGSTTPHDVEKDGEEAFPFFAEAARKKQISAVGETGLDYHYEYSPRALQKEFLIRYLHLAVETHLPIIFHCREAFEDLFAITDMEYPKKCKAVLHCFTGTLQEAEQVLERGWALSISGIVTYKKSDWLRQIAQIVPLSQLLIETDAPYLAPQSRRGEQNEPAFLVETASCIAREKGISVEELAQATMSNGCSFFSL